MFPGLAILFWLVVGAVALVGGAALLVRGLRVRSRGMAAAGAAMLACVALFAAWSRGTAVDRWNPAEVRAEDVAGSWRARSGQLELLADGRFQIVASGDAARRVGISRTHGSWALDDWNLTLTTPDGAAHELRVVVAHGEYRIIEDPGDLDGWTPWAGFRRTPPSRARPCTLSCD